MNKPLSILCDMDDVLEELLPSWCAWLNLKHGLSVQPKDIMAWDMTRTFTMLSAEEVYEPLFSEAFWYTVPPKPGAAETVRLLISEGHPFYVVTAAGRRTVEAKMEWALFAHFPFLDWSQVIVASNKALIKGDVIIDDAVHNLGGDRALRLLMDAPHNRNYDEAANGAIRVFGWKDIYRVIKDYEAKEEYV